MSRVVTACCALAFLATSACSTPSSLPRGTAAYPTIQASGEQPPPLSEYRIVPGDILSVIVFQEPDLSLKDVPVDKAGSIDMPLIGRVEAAGKSSYELSAAIAAGLGQRYLVAPRVSVYVTKPVDRVVVVEGSVNSPGVFPIRPETTLVEAVALARGPTDVAKLSEVIVFRTIEGQRMGAVFNLAAIRRGDAVNPMILPDDIVVVGFSSLRQNYRDFLQAAPMIGLFRRF